VFELEAARLEVPGRVLFENVSMHLERGEHVTLVGANGSGKTTLIDTLTGRRELGAGKLRTGHNVTVGYVSQHEEELKDEGSVLDAVQRATQLTPGKARALLGHFLFSGDDVRKPVSALSGGERRRVSLAILVSSGANMLVLDEPTNHLDIESREALEDALRGFPGSLLLVSHDRALLDAVGTRTLAVEEGELRTYEGSWAEYVQAREQRRSAQATATPKQAKAEARRAKANGTPKPTKAKAARAKSAGANGGQPASRPSKNAQRAQRALEREIETAEESLRALEGELADPEAWSDPERSSDSSRRHAEAKRRIEELYARWEHTSG
jgi:ATP-binding cassette subfamily F protein 3